MLHWLLFFLLVSTPTQAAIVASGLTAGGLGAGACTSPVTTASITPTANALVFVCMTTEIGTAPVPTISGITGAGLTWVEVASQNHTGNNLTRTTLYRALGASPSTGTLSITLSGTANSGCTWAIGQFTGVDTSGTNGSGAIVGTPVQSFSGGVTSLTETLPAFASATNIAVGCFGGGSSALTPGTGFSNVVTPFSGTSHTNLISDANDTTVDVTSGSQTIIGIAVEVKEAVTSTTRRKWAPRLLQLFPLFAPVRVETLQSGGRE